MKYLTWNKTSHLLCVGTWWDSILKWKLELLTCFEKDVPAFRKITGFRVCPPGEEYPEKWLIMCVSLYMSLSSIIFELCISQSRNFLLICPQCITGVGKYVPFSCIWQSKGWCWSCMFQNPPFTAAEINLKAISPISKWKENLHILQNEAIDLPLTREILLKWISNTAVKFTALISLQCKTYLIMQ